jgi:hypothetical protein
VANWCNSIGVTGIVLKYRVPRRTDNPHLEERIELHEWISVGSAVVAVLALSIETPLPILQECIRRCQEINAPNWR